METKHNTVRIHSFSDELSTLLDPRRPDGWVASDETYETQPYGVSACDNVRDLMGYIDEYSLCANDGDVLVGLVGDSHPARDLYETRTDVASYTVLLTIVADTWVELVGHYDRDDLMEALVDGDDTDDYADGLSVDAMALAVQLAAWWS